jgi:hypothetical protein
MHQMLLEDDNAVRGDAQTNGLQGLPGRGYLFPFSSCQHEATEAVVRSRNDVQGGFAFSSEYCRHVTGCIFGCMFGEEGAVHGVSGVNVTMPYLPAGFRQQVVLRLKVRR